MTFSHRPVNFFTLSSFWFGINFHWSILSAILIPAEIVKFVGNEQKGSYLGIMLSISAIIPLILPPVLGAYSDKIGRRLPFIGWGVGINIIGLVLMAFSPSFWIYFAAFLLVQFGNNLASAPYSALIPDLVPKERRGQASGIMSMLQLVAGVSAGLVAFLLNGNRQLVYMLIALVLLISGLVTIIYTPETKRIIEQKRTVWFEPLRNTAFRFVFLSRFCFNLGQYSVQPFFQYYLTDVIKTFHIGSFHLKNAQAATPILLLVIAFGGIVSSFIGGRISDRIGRKPVIYVSGILMITAAILFLFAPNLEVAMLFGAIFGFGFGAFSTVDWALGSDVMSNPNNYARDMGIWHIAFVAPQIIQAPGGKLLDFGNGLSQNLGYSFLFGMAIIFFIVNLILIRRVPGIK